MYKIIATIAHKTITPGKPPSINPAHGTLTFYSKDTIPKILEKLDLLELNKTKLPTLIEYDTVECVVSIKKIEGVII